MARNEEKSMSMLYRFREAQQAELGLSQRSDKRPRAAISVKDLRQCEKWRGEVLREISRKVSKIQDPGLNQYEIRDLNDEINKLLREKNNWESQIVALGGANYKRSSIRSYDADGKEVPNIRGYKYFGRARELPGVKELFEASGAIKKTPEEEEEASKSYSRFVNPPPGYFGDLDNSDLEEEEKAWEERRWQEGFSALRDEFGLGIETPPVPEEHFVPFEGGETTGKRKGEEKKKGGKKAKKEESVAGFTTILNPEELKAPALPEPEELEKYIVEQQKKALLSEYVDGQ